MMYLKLLYFIFVQAEYTMSHSLGGVMVYSLNHDDYNGVCAGTSFLLIRQIKNILIDKEL